ncbi:MAG: hypothetical protein M3Y21_11335 [Candidatus Eremiobacteraeota bacterium]|nr:hypothetical protein [Candidatus Eremiobacteraeota bacterium]
MILEIHYGIAFLVVLCAAVFSWSQMGRRVMAVVLGIQILIGIIAAGLIRPLPPVIFIHILGALLALAAYMIARRLTQRSGNGAVPLTLSVIGLVLVMLTAYLGMHAVGLF